MYGYNFGMAGSMTPANYGQMPVQPQYRQSMPINLQGRVVASVDEVRAAQVALDGSLSYFPSPGEGKIYVKGVDMQGLPYVQVFTLQQAAIPAAVGNADIQSLEARIVALENQWKGMSQNVQSATANTNAG